ncbi:cysteine hydrolase family protein [Roseibium sp. MMSF_3412]|uniref:cysteine hydrolase family protein n=1 Tax=Roseibium sp. MMSF_3412 TaxID=3046712 RepID=UPI00273E9425|nr:isochorismatase family cysteine hydrolase [Roseibium sp. MMSF_3412]
MWKALKAAPVAILSFTLIALTVSRAVADFDDTSASYYDKTFYTKIPWTVTQKKTFDELLQHNLRTPDTELHRDKTALLIIDTQNDWGTAKGSAPETDIETVVPNIAQQTKLWRETGSLIVHIVRMYYADGSDADMARRWQMEKGQFTMAVPGTWGSELVASTTPGDVTLDYKTLLNLGVQQIGPNEYVIYKPHYNGFDRSSLNAFLKAKDIDSVVFIGMTFPNCVRATQYGATDHHYRVGAVPEAITQVYPGGLVAMQRQGVQLMSMDDFAKFAGSISDTAVPE